MPRHAGQKRLFDTPVSLPNGLVYRPQFLTEREEEDLLDAIGIIPLTHPEMEGYAAKRRVKVFGWRYDFEKERLIPGAPLPPFLAQTQKKIAKWLDIPVRRVAHALVTEYEPGTALGWHRDNEAFESIVGISLSGWATIRFRPLARFKKPAEERLKNEVVSFDLEPRSAYVMQKAVRWDYQHSVVKTKGMRYSITFRTLPEGVKAF